MTDNITPIEKFRKKKEDAVYECACGSQHFYLLQPLTPDLVGAVQCRKCDLIINGVCWGTGNG